jgi:hypothetical protein
MTDHELKTWPTYYAAVAEGRKRFEARQNDRDFRMGDRLHLREWDPKAKAYTGRAAWYRVTYMMEGGVGLDLGLPVGLCIMSIWPTTAPGPGSGS